MSLQIDFLDETNLITKEQIEQLEKLLKIASEVEGIKGDCELSITFVTNEKIHEINRQYRGIDRPTDVISFALEEMGEEELEVLGADLPRVLGDIIISIPKAIEQAKEYGHSFARELGFLTVHGFLHLLGYDHMNEEDEKMMFQKQEDILQKFGLTR